METALAFIERQGIAHLDVTGGSPEMHPDFRGRMRVVCIGWSLATQLIADN